MSPFRENLLNELNNKITKYILFSRDKYHFLQNFIWLKNLKSYKS